MLWVTFGALWPPRGAKRRPVKWEIPLDGEGGCPVEWEFSLDGQALDRLEHPVVLFGELLAQLWCLVARLFRRLVSFLPLLVAQ